MLFSKAQAQTTQSKHSFDTSTQNTEQLPAIQSEDAALHATVSLCYADFINAGILVLQRLPITPVAV